MENTNSGKKRMMKKKGDIKMNSQIHNLDKLSQSQGIEAEQCSEDLR